MRKIIKVIDSASNVSGHVVLVLCYGLIAVVVYSVFMRYVFNRPPMWTYDTAIMTGGSMFILAWSYTHLLRGHVRVDVFYSRFSARTKAIFDTLGTLFLLFPLFVFLIKVSYKWMARAWEIKERFLESYWLPPAAPIRTVVFVGFCLFVLQALAQFIRDLYFALMGRSYD